MSHLDMIRFVRECYPEYKGQLYVNMTDCANIFGLSVKRMREHITINAIPWRRPVREKMYNVLEVLDSIEKTKWKE